MALYETVMAKGYETLVDSGTRVEPPQGSTIVGADLRPTTHQRSASVFKPTGSLLAVLCALDNAKCGDPVGSGLRTC